MAKSREKECTPKTFARPSPDSPVYGVGWEELVQYGNVQWGDQCLQRVSRSSAPVRCCTTFSESVSYHCKQPANITGGKLFYESKMAIYFQQCHVLGTPESCRLWRSSCIRQGKSAWHANLRPLCCFVTAMWWNLAQYSAKLLPCHHRVTCLNVANQSRHCVIFYIDDMSEFEHRFWNLRTVWAPVKTLLFQ